MSKKKLTLEQEATVLFYLENHRGKKMKGETRTIMYEVYSYFMDDGRTDAVCSCLDRDTHRKVDNFINDIEWSKDVLTSPRLKKILPDVGTYEEESTQPVKVDIKKVARAIKKRKTTKKK